MLSGGEANGFFDFDVSLWDAATGGTLIGATNTLSTVMVSNGLFTISPDFGAAAFNGNARWLELDVRTNGGGSFTVLSPRQPVMPSPYALEAANALNASVATNVTGPISDSQLSTNVALLNHGIVATGDVGIGQTAANGVAPLTVDAARPVRQLDRYSRASVRWRWLSQAITRMC